MLREILLLHVNRKLRNFINLHSFKRHLILKHTNRNDENVSVVPE